VPIAVSPSQLLALQQGLGLLATRARGVGLTDQEMAEWLLSLAGRWLTAHGVSNENVHAWLELELRNTVSPVPLVAAARTRNDFGGMR
jgi:hypothetical protein